MMRGPTRSAIARPLAFGGVPDDRVENRHRTSVKASGSIAPRSTTPCVRPRVLDHCRRGHLRHTTIRCVLSGRSFFDAYDPLCRRPALRMSKVHVRYWLQQSAVRSALHWVRRIHPCRPGDERCVDTVADARRNGEGDRERQIGVRAGCCCGYRDVGTGRACTRGTERERAETADRFDCV